MAAAMIPEIKPNTLVHTHGLKQPRLLMDPAECAERLLVGEVVGGVPLGRPLQAMKVVLKGSLFGRGARAVGNYGVAPTERWGDTGVS